MRVGAKIRITAFIGEELAKKFTELTRGIGISGTALLNRTLPSELNYLAELPSISEMENVAAKVRKMGLRMMEKLDVTRPKTRRFNITLGREDAERMNELCREKRVPRDRFIGGYIAFLVNGQDGVCEAPLKKISEILMNPRHEYEERLRTGPVKDETLYNLDDESFTLVEAVPQVNPYSYLHFDEEELNLLERFMKNRTAERR